MTDLLYTVKILCAAALIASMTVSANAQPQSWGPTTSASTPLTPPTAVPATIAGSGTYSTGCVPTTFARAFTAFAALSGAGTLSVQRYADAACTQPVAVAIPTSPLALTQGGGCPASSYCGDDGANDGHPFAALIATLTDTSASTNTVVGFTMLAGAE